MLTEEQISGLIEIVREAGRREIMPRFRRLSDDDIRAKSSPDDLVTEADIAAERFIMDEVGKLLPDAVFVGEEAQLDAAAIDTALAADLCVVIDPVDGTYNFAHGLATFGTILAVVSRGETVFGLLYDTVLDDWVMARKGGGSFYGRPDAAPRPLHLSQDTQAGRLKGYLPLFLYEEPDRRRLAPIMPDLGRVTTLGSSCHEYRQMLLGSVDFIMNAGLNVWDHAAGVLAVQEAGGIAKLSDGAAYVPNMKQGQLRLTRSEAIMRQLEEVMDA